MGKTKIEWASDSWNPITGCTPVSEGCENCYARRMAYRLRGQCGYPDDDPFRVTLHPNRLEEPYSWRKPRRVFVCSMSDLFHDGVPDDFICKIFEVILDNPEHTFIVLTKRPYRMKEFIERLGWITLTDDQGVEQWLPVAVLDGGEKRILNNLWLLVTVENQARADERIPILLQTPAAVRGVSCEPLLGPLDLQPYLRCENCGGTGLEPEGNNPAWHPAYPCRVCGGEPGLDWVIVGGETGPGARPIHPDWVRSLRDQCQAASVPFFFKQWGEWAPLYETGEEFELARLAHNELVMSGPGHGVVMKRVGRRVAGRFLDGRTWDELPT